MKTTVEKPQFDSALAMQRIEQIRTKNRELADTVKWKIEQGIQKLLQIILRNVTINKNSEIGLRIGEERFSIHYIYDLENKYSMDIEFCFAKRWDIYELLGSDKSEKAEKSNINVGDIKDVSFAGFKMDFLKGDKFEDFDCLLLYGYIGKQLRDNDGDFLVALKEIYADLRVFWDDIDKGWSEGRELKSQIEKHAKENFENEIRKSNYFKEGNFIVVRDIKKDFLEASVYQIGKVQKTTFYAKQLSIEIKELSYFGEKTKVYGLSIEKYRHEEKRRAIDTYISSWASSLLRGNRIEVLNTEEWKKIETEITNERDLIKDGKLDDKSKMYEEVKYRKQD